MLAAGAGAAGFALTRTPKTALAPWKAAGGSDDPRLNALSWSILAPNPHNRQPWQAELVGDQELRIHRDKSLNLPETDPFDRQLTIGMGCFLEVLRMAAAEQGYALEQRLYPDGEDGAVAHVSFAEGGRKDPLFAQVLKRHTNRQPYEARLPDDEALAALAKECTGLITDTEAVAELRDLTWKAMQIEMQTHRTHMESVNLMRFGKAEINANPDGISLRGPMLEALMAAGMLTRDGQADPATDEYKQTADFLRTSMDASPAYCQITTDANTRSDQIEAGRQWVRLHLVATEHDIAMQPLSQALQEYPEQSELYQQVHQKLAPNGGTVQMLGRFGYGPRIGPSPRWPIESRILTS
ncbi:MAG: nitroreductase family protein [Alphaproteobacteria bacterium]